MQAFVRGKIYLYYILEYAYVVYVIVKMVKMFAKKK